MWLRFIKVTKYMHSNIVADYLDECTLLNSIEGEYILKTYDSGIYVQNNTKYIYIVYEYKKGVLLQDILEGNYLHIEGLVSITTQILKSLNILHSNDIYFANLCPSNILLDSNYRIKILNVGLTKANKGVHIQDTLSKYYISPSQLNINYSDKETDFYLLGVMLFVAMFNKFPYDLNDNPIKLLASMDKGIEWHMLPSYHSKGNAKLLSIVKKLLNRTDKYNSIEEILIDLSSVLYSKANIGSTIEESEKVQEKGSVLLIENIETKLLY